MLQFASGDNVVHVLIWNALGEEKRKVNTEFIFWWISYYGVYKRSK